MNARRVRGAVAVLAALAITTLATACGGTETTGTAASAGGDSSPRSGSATSPTSPTPRRSSASRRASSPSTSAAPRSRPAPSTPARPRSRRSSPARSTPPTSAQPGDQRLGQVEGRGHQDRRRRGVRRRVLVVKPRSPGATTSRARRSPRPQLGNTQDVALRSWLKEQGLDDRHRGRRRRLDHPAGQRPDPAGLRSRRDRRRLGARAVGHAAGPGGRRQDPRRRGATCGRTASSSPPT